MIKFILRDARDPNKNESIEKQEQNLTRETHSAAQRREDKNV